MGLLFVMRPGATVAYNQAVAGRLRIDRLLVDRGLVESREQAARLILAGSITVDGRRVDKAGAVVATDADLEVLGRSPYVSRGEKLAHALDGFGVEVSERICLDVGASTGASPTACSSVGPAAYTRST